MRFLVDAQLPPALARWLEGRGFEAEHVVDCRLASAHDSAIWQRAATTGAVIVTKDEDFAIMRDLQPTGPQVLWLRMGNTRKGALLSWFDRALPEVIDALERGETLVEAN